MEKSQAEHTFKLTSIGAPLRGGCTPTPGSIKHGRGPNRTNFSQYCGPNGCGHRTLGIASVLRQAYDGTSALLSSNPRISSITPQQAALKTNDVARSHEFYQVCGPTRPDRLGQNNNNHCLEMLLRSSDY